MRRRTFIVAGIAVGMSPPLAYAQAEKVRRIGVLMNLAENDADSQVRLRTFLEELRSLGWIYSHNISMEIRWGEGRPENFRRHAANLAATSPDLLLAASGPVLAEVLAVTRTVPIVFAHVIDPVGNGFVESLNRPGGNATGFTLFDNGMSEKWLELLKEVMPSVARAAVLYDKGAASGLAQLKVIEAAAPAFGIELTPIDLRDPKELEHAVRRFAAAANGALIVTASPLTGIHRRLIFALSLEHRLPSICPFRNHAREGGLVAYAPDLLDSYRRAAHYADRILRGAAPGDLPVQNPVKFELAINLKTAKALGLTVPLSLLARADEVIE